MASELDGRTRPADEVRRVPTQVQLDAMRVGDVVTSRYDPYFMDLRRRVLRIERDASKGSGWGVQMDDGHGRADAMPPEEAGSRPYSLLPEPMWPRGLIDGAWASPVEDS